METIGIIIALVGVCIWIFAMVMIFSPKIRGKFMGRQIKSMKYMLDSSKDTISDIAATQAEIQNKALKKSAGNIKDIAKTNAKIKKDIVDENADVLKETTKKTADIESEAIRTKARAVREGLLKDDSTVFCRYCGKTIESDSKFCKHCGEKQ